MIRNEGTIEIQRSGDFDESTFRIDHEDVSLILEIIRNKLYTNKMGSFVREICSNAYDAMVEAGTTETNPIEITLPTDDNHNTLTIRDYGTGMSDAKIKSIYTRVGKSTRSNSNKFVGMMGIGRLVGFSLTDSFNVVSFVDGIRTEYLCYIDETKCGKVAQLSQQETTEKNGVAICVNVPSDQYSSLSTELKTFITFITEVKFVIKNNTEDESYHSAFYRLRNITEESVILFNGTGWTNYENRINSVAAFVKMGVVKYPIPTHMTTSAFFRNGSYIFHVPIGDVTVSASREGLEFTPQTTEYIKKLFETAKEETAKKTLGVIQTQPDIVTALKSFGDNRSAWEALDRPKVMWTDPTTKRVVNLNNIHHKYYKQSTFTVCIDEKTKKTEVDANGNEVIYQIKHDFDEHEFRRYCITGAMRSKETNSVEMYFTGAYGESKVYYRIVPNHEIESLPDVRRCRTIYSQYTGLNAFVYVFTERGLKRFIDKEGYDPTAFWIKFETLAETILPRGTGTRAAVDIRVLNFTYDATAKDSCNFTSSTVEDDLDNLAPGYWVARRYSSIYYDRDSDKVVDELELINIFKSIVEFTQTSAIVYILPAACARMLAKSSEYNDLTPCKDYVHRLLTTTKLVEHLCGTTTDISVPTWDHDHNFIRKFYTTDHPVQSPYVKNILGLVKNAIRPHIPGERNLPVSVIDKLKDFHSGTNFKIVNVSDILNEEYQKLHERFPLLPDSLSNIYCIKGFVDRITVYDEYVHATDKLRSEYQAILDAAEARGEITP